MEYLKHKDILPKIQDCLPEGFEVKQSGSSLAYITPGNNLLDLNHCEYMSGIGELPELIEMTIINTLNLK